MSPSWKYNKVAAFSSSAFSSAMMLCCGVSAYHSNDCHVSIKRVNHWVIDTCQYQCIPTDDIEAEHVCWLERWAWFVWILMYWSTLSGWIEFYDRKTQFSQTANSFEYLCIGVVCVPELSFTIVKLNSARQRISIGVVCVPELSFTIVKLNSAIQGICMITYFLSLAVWLILVLRS